MIDRRNRVCSLLLFALICALAPSRAFGRQWRPVRGGIEYNISGLALLKQDGTRTSFLVVHDNKKPTEARIGKVTIEGPAAPVYETVAWPPEDLPIDLESICAVPDQAEQAFIALTSAGKAYHIRYDDRQKRVSILRAFDLPDIPAQSNFEGLALQTIGSKLVVVWTHRGQDADPAVIYCAHLDLKTYRFTNQGKATFRSPFPDASVRHVTDVKMDSGGALYVASASDPGDDGPFQSAIYVAGTLEAEGNRLVLHTSLRLTRLRVFAYHKVEALELVPGAGGGLVFGTDDETMGGSLFRDW